MNIRDLEYACAVAELEHFGHAAEKCHVSQPTLSGQIRKLEEHLGVQLFERTNRSVRVTPVGEQIVAIARTILASAREIELTAEANRDPASGKLRVGMIPTIAPYLIPLVLPPLRSTFPSLTLVLVEDTTDRLLARLADDEIEAAVLATTPVDRRLPTIPLYREPFWFALPHGHAGTKRRTLDPKKLDPSELLLLRDGHCLREQALAICGDDRAHRQADTSATSLETLVNLVADGQGITLVPALALDIAKRVEGVEVRRASSSDALRLVRFVYRPGFPHAALLEQIASAIRNALPSSVTRVLAPRGIPI